MNKALIGIISGIGGSVLGFFVSKQIYAKYYENLAQQEIDSVKETYKAKYARDFLQTVGEEKRPIEDVNKSHRTVKNPLANEPVGNMYRQVKLSYIPEEAHEEYPLEMTETEELNNTFVLHNEIITKDSFINDFTHYDKVELIYDVESATLLDEDGAPYDTLEDVVGYDLSLIVVKAMYTNTLVHVRNYAIETDFEIVPKITKPRTPREMQMERVKEKDKNERSKHK